MGYLYDYEHSSEVESRKPGTREGISLGGQRLSLPLLQSLAGGLLLVVLLFASSKAGNLYMKELTIFAIIWTLISLVRLRGENVPVPYEKR